MNRISFSKYSGCGNDFILIDNREDIFPCHDKSLIKNLCHRNLGIGADGLILFESEHSQKFIMRIFNADGGEAEMCGNGLRSFGIYLSELGIKEKEFSVGVMGSWYDVAVEPHFVSVSMRPPSVMQWDVDLKIDDEVFTIHYLNTGVPHVVQFVDDMEFVNIQTLGPRIRYHEKFAPSGTNVNFAKILTDQMIEVRTYERGVEDETLSCGTGATACALAAFIKYRVTSPISVKTRSKEFLEFEIAMKEGELERVIMRGPAKKVYSGIVEL